VYPGETFSNSMTITLGGEHFKLHHAPGETEDQLYFWAPERKILESADYHQGFLPNAGNGKRVQRYVKEWAGALMEMALLEPEIILPGHGEAMEDPESCGGWWDGLPSSYNPPPMKDLAIEITESAGGIEALINRTYDTARTDIAVACRLADYAWLAAPDNPSVHKMILDIYGERITNQAETTQEMLAYLDHMTAIRAAMNR